MPEPAAGLRDAGELIRTITAAAEAGEEMLALVCARAQATEVALAATVLRDYLAQLGRLRLEEDVLAAAEARGIAVGRAQLLAEQAAEAERRRASAPRLHVVRPQRVTGAFPALPHTAGGA